MIISPLLSFNLRHNMSDLRMVIIRLQFYRE